jgi:hypothetical protein
VPSRLLADWPDPSNAGLRFWFQRSTARRPKKAFRKPSSLIEIKLGLDAPRAQAPL